MEPKISLSLLVPGARIFTQGECEKIPNERYNKEVIKLIWEEGRRFKSETIVITTRKNRPITQHINISKDAYDHMLATPSEPKLSRKWKNMPKNDRLKAHFDLIAEQLKAISYEYEILDD